MKSENDNPAYSAQQKYLYLSRYRKAPLPMWLIYAFDWALLLFSGAGTGYLIYWSITLRYRQDGIIWLPLIAGLLIGLSLSTAMYLKVFSDTSDRVHKESEKGKNWFNSLIFFETSWDVLIIRATGILGMMLFSYGVIDDFNKGQAAQVRKMELLQSRVESNREAEMRDEMERYFGRLANGNPDDDSLAFIQIARLDSILQRIDIESREAQIEYRAALSAPGLTDNTAMVRFLSKGDHFRYGMMILLIVAIVAASIDGAANTMTRFIAKKTQADLAKEIYDAEIIRQVDGVNHGQPVNGYATVNSSGGGGEDRFGINWDSERIQAILNQLINFHLPGSKSQAEIAREFECERQYVNRIWLAAKESGRIPDA